MSPVVIKRNVPQNERPAPAAFNESYDSFDVPQAFRDWLQLLIAPRSFFEDQEGATGMLSPLALLLAYALAYGAFCVAMMLGYGSRLGIFGFFAILIVILAVPVVFAFYVALHLIWGGIAHLAGRLFGGTGVFSGSFRASVYAFAPISLLLIVAGILTMILTPPWDSASGSRGLDNPLIAGADAGGALWGVVLLGMGLCATHRMTPARGVGATLLTCGAIVGIFFFLIGLRIALTGA